MPATALSNNLAPNTSSSVNKIANKLVPLARRTALEAKVKTVTLDNGQLGKQISQLDESSPLFLSGLKLGDVIVSVNTQTFTFPEQWYDFVDSLVENKRYQFGIKRDQQDFAIEATFNGLPLEQHPNLTVSYQQITSSADIKQRIIITKPRHDSPLPAIFFIQGLSCSSIEILPHRKSNYVQLIKDIVQKSNMVVMRVEKPGLGDSEGNCSATDFSTELAGYEAALQNLQKLPYVDKNKILIYGNSMGSALAPYLADKYSANAVIADGTFFRSWFEHMLEIERRILAMKGHTQTEISNMMNKAYIPLYYGMLINKQSYQQVVNQKPELAKYNYHGAGHMYGRPMSYYDQLQEFDFAGHWQNLKIPVRIRWGTNDWIMSESDNDMIIDTLSSNGNNNAELFKYPGLDHWSTIHPSAKNSFQGKPGTWQDNISQQIVDWAAELNK